MRRHRFFWMIAGIFDSSQRVALQRLTFVRQFFNALVAGLLNVG